MPNQTPSTPNMDLARPLSLIYLPGWKYGPKHDYLDFAAIWRVTWHQPQESASQKALLANVRVLTADILLNPKTRPKQVIQELAYLIDVAIRKGHNVGLIGHAIGGYYAAYMAEKYQLPAILINPLVKAYQSPLLASVLEDSPELEPVQGQLKALATATTQPDSIMVMLQKRDLLQDYQLALNAYQHCNQIILNGGKHNFQNLQDWIYTISGFFHRYYHRSRRK